LGASGGEYTTVLRVTGVGFVDVLVGPGRDVGAAVTVGPAVGRVVVSEVVVVVVVVRGAPGGTETAGGGPVVGGTGGAGGTGTVCGPAVRGVVAGAVVVVVRRLCDSSDESFPHAASTRATASATVNPTGNLTAGSLP
jgi:hypothetical protein